METLKFYSLLLLAVAGFTFLAVGFYSTGFTAAPILFGISAVIFITKTFFRIES